jgi:putative oxidoreductase
MFTSFSRYQPQLLGLLRIVTGLLFLSHGLVKLFGFPPGAMPGPQPLASLFGAGAVIELVSGALVMIGLFTRPAAFLAAGEMAVAYWMFHFGSGMAMPYGWTPAVNGGDAAILYCFVFLYFVAAGPGAFSADGMRTR